MYLRAFTVADNIFLYFKVTFSGSPSDPSNFSDDVKAKPWSNILRHVLLLSQWLHRYSLEGAAYWPGNIFSDGGL